MVLFANTGSKYGQTDISLTLETVAGEIRSIILGGALGALRLKVFLVSGIDLNASVLI